VAVLLRLYAEQGRHGEVRDLHERAVREEPRGLARYLTAVVAELGIEPPPPAFDDEEARLRAACARGFWRSTDKLLLHLRRTGSYRELDQMLRFGLESDGTTAATWGQNELSNEEAAAVLRFKRARKDSARLRAERQ
jgi:hypothetical protein